MRRLRPTVIAAYLMPVAGLAGPDLECAGSSQIEIGQCVAAALAAVDRSVEVALGFALDSARQLDEVTGRPVSVPALKTSQAAWEAYRDAQCDYVGTTFGGGSGTGIAITGCRVTLGRARADELLKMAR